jgi:hypothetical protein
MFGLIRQWKFNLFILKGRPRDKNPFFNKKHNSETKNLISEKRIGKYFGSQNIPVVINEIEYESLGKAKEYLNIPITTIRWRILSKNPKYENYKYKDEN